VRSFIKYVIVAFVCLFIGFGLGASSIDVPRYEKEIESLTSQVSNLQETLDQKLSQIADLQSQIISKDSLIQKLQTKLQEKNSTIQELQSQITEKEQFISSLQNQISDLKQQLNLKILGVYFSPNGECEEQLLYWISRANVSIHILIYSFTLDSISDALIEAHDRGVDVKVVFEKQQITRYSEYQKLKAAGIEVRNDTNSAYMHDKIMIIDGIIVITGSYNYSTRAEKFNNENLIIILSDDVANIYEQEFEKIWEQSKGQDEGEQTPSAPQASTGVIISYVNYNPPGDDRKNLNGEYVVIENKGSKDVDLTGWILKDESNHRYIFPSFILKAGSTVTVHTGSGTNTETELYWGSGSPLWNNDGDTAYLYNKDGELIDKESW